MGPILFKPSFQWTLLPAGINPKDLGKEFKTKRVTPCQCEYKYPNGPCGSCSHNYSSVYECAGGCENNTPVVIRQCINCQNGHQYAVRLSKYYFLKQKSNTFFGKVGSKIGLPRITLCLPADDSQ